MSDRSITKNILVKNLLNNYDLLKKKANGALTVPVVKANAYGHSVKIITRNLIEHGVDYFAVAYSYEALELRKFFPKIQILVMGIPEPHHIKDLLQQNMEIAISNLPTLRMIDEIAGTLAVCPKLHIKIDTGMMRLGFRYDECHKLAQEFKKYRHVHFKGIMSHMACADNPAHPLNSLQIQRFGKCIETFQTEGISFDCRHLCNSGGTINFPQAHYDMVRIGISLYGYAPGPDMDFDPRFKPVMEVQGKISLIKPVKKGESVSYGATWQAPRDGKMAIVPIGYGDGYPRILSNGRASVSINGHCYPICGQICMDQFMIFIDDDSIKAGDDVLILSANPDLPLSADHLADAAATISYEILCDFLPRLPTVEVH